jgi:hypothetical protein
VRGIASYTSLFDASEYLYFVRVVLSPDYRCFDRSFLPRNVKVCNMTSTSSNNISSQASANAVPLFDFSRFNEMNGNMLAEAGKLNARINTTLQNIGKEWGEFVGTRLSEDNHLFQTLQTCKSLSEAQQAYAQFWQTAFEQYGEEAQQLMWITQGPRDETAGVVSD